MNFGKLLTHLGGEQTLTFVDTKWRRRLLLPTQMNSNKLETLAHRIFSVTSGSFQTCTENGDHGAKVMRNNSNTASKAAEMCFTTSQICLLVTVIANDVTI